MVARSSPGTLVWGAIGGEDEMNQPADFQLETRDQGQTAVLTGDWTAESIGRPWHAAPPQGTADSIDLRRYRPLDTAGAYGS